MKNKKIVFITSILLIFILLVGVTYAVFIYFRGGSYNNKLISGDIYMRYSETSGLTLENALPSNSYITNNYFEFQIIGKNTTTNKDIYYEILLDHGSVPNGKVEANRIDDQFLKFRLVSVENNTETEIFNNKSFNNLSSKRIHVETIDKNTTNEITHTYRLYMWIGTDVIIGNVVQADYSEANWANIFASIKVNVNGDLAEKIITRTITEGCYTISANEITGDATITDYNNNCTKNVTIPSAISGYTVTVIGDYAFADSDIISVIIPDTVETIGRAAFACNYEATLTSVTFGNGLKTIGEFAFEEQKLTTLIIPDSVKTIGEGAFAQNELTSVTIGNSVETIGDCAFVNWSEYQGNRITSIVIPNSVITIGDWAFADNRLSSLTLGNSVKTIGYGAFSNFNTESVIYDENGNELTLSKRNQITSVIIPDSVETIGDSAFQFNALTNVTIGNGVKTIGYGAFQENMITNLSLGSSVEYINQYAFRYNYLSSVTIPSSVDTIDEYAFDYNSLTSVTLTNGIKYINTEAFFSHSDDGSNTMTGRSYGPNNLTSVTIPASIVDGCSVQWAFYYWTPEHSNFTFIYEDPNDECW